MDAESKSSGRSRALLIADGALLTAGTSALAIAVMLMIWGLAGSPTANTFTQLASSVLMAAGAVAGIAGTWLLNGRHFDRFAIIGAVFGLAAAGLLVPLVGVASWFAGLFLGLFTTWEFAGPAAILSLGVAVLVVAGWRVVADAVADVRGPRLHPALDRARFASAVVVVLTAAGVLAASMLVRGSEVGEAAVFILLGAAGGAASVAGAAFGSRAGRTSAAHVPPR